MKQDNKEYVEIVEKLLVFTLLLGLDELTLDIELLSELDPHETNNKDNKTKLIFINFFILNFPFKAYILLVYHQHMTNKCVIYLLD